MMPMRLFSALIALALSSLFAQADEYDEKFRVFKNAVTALPSGTLDIPAQWFLMKRATGWEEVMLVFGYANNKSVCEHLIIVAKTESPNRGFVCLDAN